jgi:hypothetical protein
MWATIAGLRKAWATPTIQDRAKRFAFRGVVMWLKAFAWGLFITAPFSFLRLMVPFYTA